jgi:NAD(P)-dependent dehydrogenase (short-subunit alcohol dehydrogenase family)
LTGRLAIITGGSTGIGSHLVGALAEAGYAVAFSYVASHDAARTISRTLTDRGHAVRFAECDAGVKDEVDRFVEETAAWHGAAPDLLVNNAGVQTWSALLDLGEADWDRVIRTNLKGCFLNMQAVARLMKKSGRGGSVVNLGSGCNKLGFPKLVDYTASKGGIEQLTKVAAVELGPYGIRVNCVAPGSILSERTRVEDPEYEQKWSPLTPLGRVGTPEDIAPVVLFFASDAARFVTGQTLWVDGGLFTRAPWAY